MNTIVIPAPLVQSLHRELATGERIVWSGMPRASLLTAGLGIWLFAIPWTAFALFWEAIALSLWFTGISAKGAFEWGFAIVFPLFGLPFVAIGLWMLWKPIAAMRNAGSTVYALTDRRLIRVVEGRTRTVDSVMIDGTGPIERRERRDGTGDLSIQTHSRRDSEGDRITERFIVSGVADVAQLQRLITDAQSRIA